MSDAEFYAEWGKRRKEHKQAAKAAALKMAAERDDGKWIKHTEYHWSRSLGMHITGIEDRLHYWPTTDKMMTIDANGETMVRTGAMAELMRRGIM